MSKLKFPLQPKRDNAMNTAIYIAYQGDVNTFQALSIVDEPSSIDDLAISKQVSSAFRACFSGWWPSDKPVPYGFVVRMTEQGWESWEVKYETPDFAQGTAVRSGQGDDNRAAPTARPRPTAG